MTEQTRNARLARIYVERSSGQDLAAILPMLDADAEYRSTRVGNHRGREAIGAMMGGFFAGFPDVAWQVAQYEVVGTDTIEFDFVMRATDAASGETIERPGRERIVFTDAGLIAVIEVVA